MAFCNKAKSYETICSCDECESTSCGGVRKNSIMKCTCATCENMNTTCLYYKKLREDPSNVCALRRLLNEVVQRLPHPRSGPVSERFTDGTDIEEVTPSSVFGYVGNAIKKTISGKSKQITSTTVIPVVKEQDIVLCNICDQNRDECPCFYYDSKVTNLLDDLHKYLYSVKMKHDEESRHPCCKMYDPEIRDIVKKYLIKQIEKAKNCCKSEDRPTHVGIHPKTIDLITKQICSFKSPEESTCGSKKCSFHDLTPKTETDKCQIPGICQNDPERKTCPALNKKTPSRCKMEAKLSQMKSPNENESKNTAQPTTAVRKCNDCCQSDTKPKHTSTCPVSKEANKSSDLKGKEELKGRLAKEPDEEVKRSKYVKDGIVTEIVKTERAYKIINGKKVQDKRGETDKEKEKDKEYIIQTCGLITVPETTNYPCGSFPKTISCSNILTNKDSEVNMITNNNGPYRDCNSKRSLFAISRNEICDCDPCESKYCCKTKTSKNLLHEVFGSEINGFFSKPLLWQPKSVPQCNRRCACTSKSMTKQNYIIGRVEQDPHCHCSACHCMDCNQSTPFSGHIRTPEIRNNRETQEMSTSFHSNRHANCYCDSCNNRLCEQEGNETCSCGRQKDGVMRKPVTKDTNEYDIRHAMINEIDQKSWFRHSNKQQGTIAMYASLPIQNSAVRMEHPNNYDDLIDNAALRISTIEYLLGLNKIPCHTQTSLTVNPCNCKPCDCMQCQRHYKERHIPQINFMDGFCDICECINFHSNKRQYLCNPKSTCNCKPCDCTECKKFTEYRDLIKCTNEEDAVSKPTFFYKEQIHNQPNTTDLNSTDSEIYIDYLLRQLNDNSKQGTPENDYKLQEYSNICYEIKHDKDTETKNTNTVQKKPCLALGIATSTITMSVNQSSSMPQITPRTIVRDNFCDSSAHDYYQYINETPKHQLNEVVSCSMNKYKAQNFFVTSNNFCDDVPVLKKKSIACLKHDVNKILTSKKCCREYPNQGECDYHPNKCGQCYTENQYSKCRCDCTTCECSSVHQSTFIRKTEPTQTLLKSHQNRGENTIDHMSPVYSVETNRLIYDYFNPTEDFDRNDRNLYVKHDEFDIKVASDLKDTDSKTVQRTLEQSKELSKELTKMLEKYIQANKDFDSITSKYNCHPTAENEKNEISINEGCLREIKEHQNMFGQKERTEKLDTVNRAEVIVKIEAACDHVDIKPESNKLIYDLSSRSSKLLELKTKFKKFSADLDMAIGNCERNRWRKVNISNIFTPKPPSTIKDRKKWSNSELNTVFTCVTKDARSNESPVKHNKSSKQQENCDEDESMTNLIEETSFLLEKSKNSLKKLRANYVAKSGVTSDQPNLPLSPSKEFHYVMSGKRIQKSFNYDASLEEMYKRKFVSLPAMNLRAWIHERKESPQVLTFQSVSKISDHTIMVKWQTPKNMTNVIGYELLIDDRPVQKILSPKRRIAIITCLPHADKVRLTLRSIISKDNNCVPIDGPTASYLYYPKPFNKYRRSRTNFLHRNCGLNPDKKDEKDALVDIGSPIRPKPNQSVHSHVSGQPSQQLSHQLSHQLSNQLSHQFSHQLSHQLSNQLSGQYSRQLSRPSHHSHLSHRSQHSDVSHHSQNF